MHTNRRECFLVLTTLMLLFGVEGIFLVQSRAASAWPQFRGPDGRAIAEGSIAPVHFGPHSNVVWKTALPPGHSSPVVWNDRIFLTGLEGGKLETICLDRRDGGIVWRRTAPAESLEATHRVGSPAASTPATDGETVFVHFGSYGLLAYDFAGRERWKLPLPAPVVEFGAATSPIFAGDLLILNRDQDDGSHLLALDKKSGRQVWRAERPEFRRGFSTPFVWHHDGEEELVVPGSIWLRSYDLKGGKELWSFAGTSRVANSTPTSGDGLLFSASWNIGADPADRISMEPFEQFARAHDKDNNGTLDREELPAGPVRERFSQMDINKDGRVTPAEWEMMREMFAKAGNAVLAIRAGGKGDITATHLAWQSTRSLPYVSSPVYYEDRLYTVKNGGLASCYDARTGTPRYQDERIGATGDYYASLVAAGGNIYAVSQSGVVVVWKAGDKLEILDRNELGEQVMATPAFVDGKAYFRTGGQLYCFGR